MPPTVNLEPAELDDTDWLPILEDDDVHPPSWWTLLLGWGCLAASFFAWVLLWKHR